MAEIMSVLFFRTMKYSIAEPRSPAADGSGLSKGDAAHVVDAAWSLAGRFPEEELLKLRKLGSDLERHPARSFNFVGVAAGSLGQGLSCGAGMAYVGKYIDKGT